MSNINNFLKTDNYFILLAILTWSLVWKGLALWKSAQKNHKVWFILLLIFNTIGLLEIAYIFFLYKIDFKKLLTKLPSFKKKPRSLNE